MSGIVSGTRRVAREMAANGIGSIINIASIAG
jgi:short-subunit dehydrogenase